ncbi:MAG: MBOAT family O-acyltransferase [Desulfosoma sp.]
MVFASPIFLFLFLPFTLAGHFLLAQKYRNVFLLLVSLVFYAWGEPRYIAVILFSVLLNYGGAILLHRSAERPVFGITEKRALALVVIVNLLILVYYKYANFLIANINTVLTSCGLSPIEHEPVPLPIGISFFTFQAMSYVIDISCKHAPLQRNPLHCGLYIALFPQLIAGPIVRYRQIAAQIASRTVSLPGFSSGVKRFIFGLSKKVLVANPLGQVADTMFAFPAVQLTPGMAWLGLVCYSLQIYYDFSGYSDMAIGLGRMFGFEFPENFHYPYASRSLREFWRRWHMTLSSWFRDYLYIPLGGNRISPARTALNLWLVFFLCGLWHGAGWTFLAWGTLHGFYLVLERTSLWQSLVPRLWRPLQHMYTLTLVVLGWVFFRAESVSYALGYLERLFGFGHAGPATQDVLLYCDPKTLWTLGIGCLFAAPLAPAWSEKLRARILRAASDLTRAAFSLGHYALLAFLLLASAAHLAAGTYNPFIYFRF